MLITEELASFLSSHKLSLWYAGYFDDSITEELIELADFDIDADGLGKSKSKVSFLMAESFQNIIRHKLDYADGSDPHSTFGISSQNQAVNIFSANVIKDEFVSEIKEKLEGVNQLSQEELRLHYRESLDKGQFSDKGGAGLGLIEMARKSERPLQYDFSPTHEGHIFSMQIDNDK